MEKSEEKLDENHIFNALKDFRKAIESTGKVNVCVYYVYSDEQGLIYSAYDSSNGLMQALGGVRHLENCFISDRADDPLT